MKRKFTAAWSLDTRAVWQETKDRPTAFRKDERQEVKKTSRQRVDGRCCEMVRSKSAEYDETLSTGKKQLIKDDEEGVERQCILCQWLTMTRWCFISIASVAVSALINRFMTSSRLLLLLTCHWRHKRHDVRRHQRQRWPPYDVTSGGYDSSG